MPCKPMAFHCPRCGGYVQINASLAEGTTREERAAIKRFIREKHMEAHKESAKENDDG